MSQIKRLGINKLFLWSEAARYQTYPKAMARLIQGRVYTRQQIGEDLFNLSYSSRRKPHREHVLTNLFGLLQIADDKLLLRGINLFKRVTPNGCHIVSGMKVWERVTDEWIPAEAAVELGKVYHSDPADNRWRQLLAEQLARYEPRVRLLLYLLSHGAQLEFASPGYFSGNTQNTKLITDKPYELFGQHGAAFNPLLFEYGDTAIGPWWHTEIEGAGFDLVPNFKIEGAMNRPPSISHINSSLKTALYIFVELGILCTRNGTWQVDGDRFGQHLSPELTSELIGPQFTKPDLSNDWKRLAHVVTTLADQQGFVIASEAVSYWGELTDLPMREWPTAFDALVRRGIFEGRVEVLDRHLGQPRMGRGLFDDDNMRMVKLRVLI